MSRLACWAGQFTPRVSLAPPLALLLEIGGCVRLFGGLGRLRQKLIEGLLLQDVDCRIAIAPTPRAALWLAEAGPPIGSCDSAHTSDDSGDQIANYLTNHLAARLDALPLSVLTWPDGTIGQLRSFGLRRLGEVRRLPAADLGRRIGREALLWLGQAYGEVPDPRPDFVFPQQFDQSIELPAATESASALLFAARRLTSALGGWLSARQAGLRAYQLEMRHPRGQHAPSHLPIRFAAPTRDIQRLERVLAERLKNLTLVAPVELLRLQADTVEDLPGHSDDLFEFTAGHDSMLALLERLRARLGDERIFHLLTVADHRPECASLAIQELPRPNSPSSSPAAPPRQPRPLWLLSAPEALAERAGRPYRRGPLQLLAGPERLESGWWDQAESRHGRAAPGDLRRDYFIALTEDHRWAWVFRELRPPGGWYLHGWFA